MMDELPIQGELKYSQSLQAIGGGSMFGLMKKITSNPDLTFYEKGTNIHLVSNRLNFPFNFSLVVD